ncbi:MAG: ThuA domain-containing protein [Opitutaceae bacterium]|nr:ThuA domain-containing protein [Opitutaceae bacterium]
MLKRFLLLVSVLAGIGLSSGFAASRPAHLVFMIGEDEYDTWTTLPEFVEKDLKPRGYRVTIIHADKAEKNDFPGLIAALREADLLFVSVRRRTPLKEQLDAVRAHVAAGKPLLGIRTASHAFALRERDKKPEAKFGVWQGFDPEVFGGGYTNHHGAGPKTAITPAPGAEKHPILKGISAAKMVGNGSLYKVSPLKPGTVPLLIGTLPDKPAEPVAWTNRHGPKQARIFYTSLGHPDDFKDPQFRRLLVNAIDWAVEK